MSKIMIWISEHKDVIGKIIKSIMAFANLVLVLLGLVSTLRVRPA
jgi:hypothetical protein